jgi:hypothetical protein
MICSDEVSINNSSYNLNDYVFRDSYERLLPELVNTVEHIKLQFLRCGGLESGEQEKRQ